MINGLETEKVSGIYKIINKANGKYYVGSSKNIKRRWRYHKEDLLKNKHHSRYLQRNWNKYGSEAFDFVIVEKDIAEKDLLLTEQKYLDVAKLEKDICFNSSFIAGKVEFTNEIREKIRKSNTGKKHSEETKQKLREISLKQFENGMPEETKRKLSEANKGRILSRGKGWHHTEEAKKKIGEVSKKLIGPKNHRYGTRHTEEWKLLMSKKVSETLKDKTIHSFHNINTGEIFVGIRFDFIQKYDLCGGNVCSVIKGQRKSHKGWILTQNETTPS